jgi:hypothetical protein
LSALAEIPYTGAISDVWRFLRGGSPFFWERCHR